ncbi:MAG: SAM-dependent methyltransferase [Tannerellaceae bacterium]|jgi:16S rRNA (cytidine1402-2'-O)-methyltransferase|nr:SAM-dependent methyltransferase [Tannerellaceae bacterium]
MQPALYLIPVTLGDTPHAQVLPEQNKEIIRQITHFIVENTRSARRFLKQANPQIDINHLTFCELNLHTAPTEYATFLLPLEQGLPIGLISEAGCPAIADPGAEIVAIAQQKGYVVQPLVGPSSILLALMASGFNGQNFAFNGYLPIVSAQRIASIRRLETKACQERQTQIFIETPYRNNQLAHEIVQTCHPSTQLCIASDITLPTQLILTRSIKQWKNNLPDLNKKPTIFIISQ